MSVSASSVTEGGSLIYTASVNQPVTGTPLVISLDNGQSITIPVGSSSADSLPYLVRGDDAYVQGTQTLTVAISGTSGGNYEALTTGGSVSSTVTDDSDTSSVTLCVSANSVTEGGSLIYTASVNQPVTGGFQ